MDFETTANEMVEGRNTADSFFLDIIPRREQQVIRALPSYRLAADLVARSNREHGTHPRDTRLRISAHTEKTIYISDIMGFPMLKVNRASITDKWNLKCDQDLRERGSPSDELEGVRMSAMVTKLFHRDNNNSTLINSIIKNRREHNLHLISSTLGWGATKIKSEAKMPDNIDQQIQISLAAARHITMLVNDPTTMLPVSLLQEYNDMKEKLLQASNYREKCEELFQEEFGCGRWVVLPVECGYMVSSIKANADATMYIPSYAATYSLESPWFFVREFSELAVYSQDMYEQFMGAYTMMRVAEPHWDAIGFIDKAKKIPMGDRVLPNSHAIAYYSSNQLFSGGHAFLMKKLSF